MVPKMLPKFNKKIVQTVKHNIFAKRTCKYNQNSRIGNFLELK